MASGGGVPPSGSFGRGGRGLAILEAIKREQEQGAGRMGAIGSGRGSVISIGRAAALQQFQQQQGAVSSQPPPAPTTTDQGVMIPTVPAVSPLPAPGLLLPQQPGNLPATAGVARGRGSLAGLLAVVQQQRGQGPAQLGRGPLMAQSTPVTASQLPSPVALASPTPSGAGDNVVPLGAMGGLSIQESQPRQEAQLRKPTVVRMGQPGKGSETSRLAVNYIRLKSEHMYIFQYHVKFEPVVDSKSMRVGLLNEHKDIMPVKLFDGTILFTPRKLPNDETIVLSTRKTDGARIKITIRLTKELPTEQCPQLYNILLRKVMSILSLCQVGRYFYNPATPSRVPQHNLEVWPGYITSIKEEEGGLMLLLDSSHRVLRVQTVYDIMKDLYRAGRPTFQQDCVKQMVGCTVLTRYNNKTYRIDDIDWNMSPKSTFQSSTGETLTFADYYWNQYGKRVDDSQPLLINRPKAKRFNGKLMAPRIEMLCLIPELCNLTGLTDDLRSNYSIMKDLNAHTRCTPQQRLMTMKKFVDAVNSNVDARQQLNNWGLRLDDNALAVEGRRMPPENIHFGKQKSCSAGPEADWSKQITNRGTNVITAVDVENWAIFFTRNNSVEVNAFVQEYRQVGPQLGIRVNLPQLISLDNDKVDTLVQALRKSINPRLQLVCVVMPTRREDKYSAIKKITCIDHPIPSQVIVHRTLKDGRKLRSVSQKIALQINCKLGGELWAVKNPLESAMVIGIDSFHDIAGGKRSIGGFVASTNPELTRWFSCANVQMKGEELVPGLHVFVVAAIRKYFEINHRRPEKIIVYRDGVGDGQIAVVQDCEVRQIQDSFKDFGADYQPKLTVVIVQKRINTRIFQRCDGLHLDNPAPGTVLDHTVTRRDMYDYFIVSQHVRQGTVSPTHYIVVHDDINLPPERMQVFTYKMTHLYYNWPGTVRVPAPCLYAHKLAYLVGESIHKPPSPHLSDRLFFL